MPKALPVNMLLAFARQSHMPPANFKSTRRAWKDGRRKPRLPLVIQILAETRITHRLLCAIWLQEHCPHTSIIQMVQLVRVIPSWIEGPTPSHGAARHRDLHVNIYIWYCSGSLAHISASMAINRQWISNIWMAMNMPYWCIYIYVAPMKCFKHVTRRQQKDGFRARLLARRVRCVEWI